MAQVLEEEDLREKLVHRGLAQAANFTWERSARQLLGVIDSFRETS
jgi:glycosyltransferase involved in cell wall biosynthesis